jgi:hypothetical protein
LVLKGNGFLLRSCPLRVAVVAVVREGHVPPVQETVLGFAEKLWHEEFWIIIV